MILYPPNSLPIDKCYNTYRPNDELLGYWPCSNKEIYYSCPIIGTTHMRVSVVFWIENKDADQPKENGNFLFFHACDDCHFGMKFNTKTEALAWIDNCEIIDFAELIELHHTKGMGFHWFN